MRLQQWEIAQRLLFELDGPPIECTERELKKRLSQDGELKRNQVGSGLRWMKQRGWIVKASRPPAGYRPDVGHPFLLTEVGIARRDALLARRVQRELEQMREQAG